MDYDREIEKDWTDDPWCLLCERVGDLSDAEVLREAISYGWYNPSDTGPDEKPIKPDMQDLRVALIDQWAQEEGI